MARHASLAEQLKGLLEYRRRPEGAPEPVKTNWQVTPTAEVAPEDLDGLKAERRLAIRPSIEEIMRSVADGPVERNPDGKIVAIGKMRFSDGAQTERAYCSGPDGKLVMYDARMPVGAMLGTKEAQERTLGGGPIDDNNASLARFLGAKPRRSVPKTTRSPEEREQGRNYTASESRAILAQAWLNTEPAKVRYTYGAKAMPWGPSNSADMFVGMRKGASAGGGTQVWQDISSSIAEREVWAETLANLPKDDAKALDAAMTAENMKAVGTSIGRAGKHAERMGKRRLMSANDNFLEILKKAAA